MSARVGAVAGSLSRSSACLAAVVFVVASCGSADPPDAGSTSSIVPQPVETDTTIVASTTIAVDNTSPAPSGTSRGGTDADLSVLRDRIDETVARRTAAFLLEVTQTLPVPGPNGVSTVRTGAFDDELLIGHGSLRFEAESTEIADQLGAGVFEFRLIDRTYWFLNPLAEPPAWGGYDVIDIAATAGGDPTLSMDGDPFILVVAEAITEATGYAQGADGSETWSVMIRADDLLPLVTTGGVQQRLLAGGFESTGITTAATIRVDADGMVTGFESNLDEWWQQAVTSLVPEPASTPTMRVRFELGGFDSPIEVVSPCLDPAELKEPGLPDGLTCDA